MRSAHHVDLHLQDNISIARQAEVYLARLPNVAEEDIQTVLADGMVLVSNLLCGETESSPVLENHRKLASLVLAKMQRITRETSLNGKQGAYPCFTS